MAWAVLDHTAGFDCLITTIACIVPRKCRPLPSHRATDFYAGHGPHSGVAAKAIAVLPWWSSPKKDRDGACLYRRQDRRQRRRPRPADLTWADFPLLISTESDLLKATCPESRPLTFKGAIMSRKFD
jgi:hypothetical protein